MGRAAPTPGHLENGRVVRPRQADLECVSRATTSGHCENGRVALIDETHLKHVSRARFSSIAKPGLPYVVNGTSKLGKVTRHRQAAKPFRVPSERGGPTLCSRVVTISTSHLLKIYVLPSTKLPESAPPVILHTIGICTTRHVTQSTHSAALIRACHSIDSCYCSSRQERMNGARSPRILTIGSALQGLYTTEYFPRAFGSRRSQTFHHETLTPSSPTTLRQCLTMPTSLHYTIAAPACRLRNPYKRFQDKIPTSRTPDFGKTFPDDTT